jgi:hypothetical protein
MEEAAAEWGGTRRGRRKERAERGRTPREGHMKLPGRWTSVGSDGREAASSPLGRREVHGRRSRGEKGEGQEGTLRERREAGDEGEREREVRNKEAYRACNETKRQRENYDDNSETSSHLPLMFSFQSETLPSPASRT